MKNVLHDVLRRDTEFGFLDKCATADQLYHPLLISNAHGETMLKAIRQELKRSHSFEFSVAFISAQALAQLKQVLRDFAGPGTIVTSRYLDFNEPDMFRELLELENVDVFVHNGDDTGFHPKGYVFHQESTVTAIVGSSNLTSNALNRNQEWNLRFSALPEGHITDQLGAAIAQQIANSEPLTEQWISNYEQTRRNKVAADAPDVLPVGRITPNAMQREALAEIRAVRDSGERRAVVVSATGTGKTILAALAVREAVPQRFLFIVHREQILDKAIQEFQRVLEEPASSFGKFVGTTRQLDRKYVFATVQSLSRQENLEAIAPDTFDFVIVDEVHRVGAATYRRILDWLTPAFLLGLTATPERTDDFNVFELFDFNVPYEIRLQAALENDMLAPFTYYGVTDVTTASGEVIDDTSALKDLVAQERVDHILKMLRTYGFPRNVRGLMFCSTKQEARELSAILNDSELYGRLLRTKALTGDDSMETREQVIRELEEGKLDYILTVDIFNEGIDIPCVNQVVMLRQTQSSIIFTQQLGRGLRKSAGKDHLRVIDFIGNYKNNYLIPIALFGDSSLNKDNIRRRILGAEDSGTIVGVSTVSFDAISRQRILDSLVQVSLDSMTNLKKAVNQLHDRLNTIPRLYDFARFDTVDPVILAKKQKTYWDLLVKCKKVEQGPSQMEREALAFFAGEVLEAKRPQEALLAKFLLDRGTVSEEDFAQFLVSQGCNADLSTIRTVIRVFSFEFLPQVDRERYGNRPLVTKIDGKLSLTSEVVAHYHANAAFRWHIDDAIETALYLARHKHSWLGELQIGHKYSRRDVCRILNWEKNQSSTVYGYKVDYFSNSCPIFVTYHKSDDVSDTTKYEDAFDDPATLHWFTKSKRTLASMQEKTIAHGEVPLHVFVKKDDVEGTDFYYLGKATPRNAEEGKIRAGEHKVDIVHMRLDLEQPVDTGLYEYLTEH